MLPSVDPHPIAVNSFNDEPLVESLRGSSGGGKILTYRTSGSYDKNSGSDHGQGTSVLEIRANHDGYVNASFSIDSSCNAYINVNGNVTYFTSSETKRVNFTKNDLITIVMTAGAYGQSSRSCSYEFDWH